MSFWKSATVIIVKTKALILAMTSSQLSQARNTSSQKANNYQNLIYNNCKKTNINKSNTKKDNKKV